jgi:hypothetical protein
MGVGLKKNIATMLFLAVLIVSSFGCIPVQSDRQLMNIEAQLQTLKTAIASAQQELASAKQALSETQEKNKLFEQQAKLATNGNGLAANLITNPVNTAIAPTIVSFTAIPTIISPGQVSNLQWNVTGAVSVVTIIPSIGNVPYTGVLAIYPTTSTTYILTATNSYGSVTAYATINVIQQYPSSSFPYYSGYPYYAPNYSSPPALPPPPRRPPIADNRTRPRPPFPPPPR